MNGTHASNLCPMELLTLTLTLRGHSLKQVALELDVSNALACRIRRDALNKVGAENVCQFVIGCASGVFTGFERPTLGSEGIALDMTRAEHEVARQVVLGLSNATIAARRGTAQRTVANQLASLYRKLKVQSRLELALVLSARGQL
jgi:DNA-binding CsgD family transcriptional regulator